MAYVSVLKLQRKISLVLFSCFIAVLMMPSAQAGFEWVPPTQAERAEPNPVVAIPPVAPNPGFPEPLQSTPIYQTPVQSMPTQKAPVFIGDRYAEPPMARPKPRPQPVTQIEAPAPVLKRYSPKPMAREPQVFEVDSYAAPTDIDSKINPYPNLRSAQTYTPNETSGLYIAQDKKQFSVNARTSDIYAPPALRGQNQPAAGAFSEVVGFGSDVPLALALNQIVPAGYSYSFAPGINPGKRVSWDGGKPWNDVVTDMVEPLGYGISIDGKALKITGQRTSQNIGAPSMAPSAIMRAPVEDIKPDMSTGMIKKSISNAGEMSVDNKALKPFQASALAAPAAASSFIPVRRYGVPSIGTPIGELPFEKHLIEPASGDVQDPPLKSEPITLTEIVRIPEPEALPTTEETVSSALEALEPIQTPRRYKRDPGETLVERNNVPSIDLQQFKKADMSAAAIAQTSEANQSSSTK